ncbi:uncharacterized protein LOC9640977 [Selaginella moellendorffii]|nr:uncharacterized protein LOC9640977 [Selaginella moellendorffii]|eukprot:XP_024522873.1 uncharacterized protein LOC9640977 [Selaginella moellendorffii]
MGCSSSKNVDVYHGSKAHPLARSPVDDAHLVALTSSTYGFLRVDSHKKSSSEEAAAVADDPVNEVYQKMMSLESGGSQLPQSWSEVNSVLTQLKSQAQHKKTSASALSGRVEPETVDVLKLLQSVEEAPPKTPKAPAPPAASPPSQPKREFSVIHTLEEVDQLAYSNSAASQDSDTESEEDFFRHSSMPNGRSSNGANATNRFSMSSVVRRPDSRSKVPSKASRSLSTYGDGGGGGDAGRQVDSTLFDAEFLESFREAFEQLSTGVSAAATAAAGKQGLSQPRPKVAVAAKSKAMVSSQGANRQDRSKVAAPPAMPVSDREEEEAEQQATRGRGETRTDSKAGTVQSKVADWNEKNQAADRSYSSKAPPPAPPAPAAAMEIDLLQHCPKRCPPDGENKAVLYSTSLRGIRKTFEDCNTVRNILHSTNVEVDERDVSMDSQFRQELKDLMDKPVPVPRLFIKGRYIGGAEEVVAAHESGALARMLHGLPHGNLSKDCDGCGGVRFIPCTDCSGSCKSVGADGGVVKCPECNENGLVRCPICS